MDLHSPANDALNNFISSLESTFSESLCIQDDQKSENALEGNSNCDVADESLCGGFEQQDLELNKKCLQKCATFPHPEMMLPPSSLDDEDEKANTSLTESLSKQSAQQTYSRSISLPVSSQSCYVCTLFCF